MMCPVPVPHTGEGLGSTIPVRLFAIVTGSCRHRPVATECGDAEAPGCVKPTT